MIRFTGVSKLVSIIKFQHKKMIDGKKFKLFKKK